MKKLLIFGTALVLFSNCQKNKTYVTLSGTVENPNSKEFKLIQAETNQELKIFMLNDNNQFSDTITLEKGNYVFYDGAEYMLLYLKPGDELNIKVDATKFDETLTFEGNAAEINTYNINKIKKQNAVFEESKPLFSLDEVQFNSKFDSIKKSFETLTASIKNPDPDFIKTDSINTAGFLNYLSQQYVVKSAQLKMIGQPSPTFDNYMNFKGGTTSLKDLKGKYVYIDVWATWCKPCLGEIPSLKALEETYGAEMHFVSISVDKPSDLDTWKKMVTEKELKGLQLFANADQATPFDQAYQINSIPRFILIDPMGNIVDPDAPRPSDAKTAALFKELLNL